MQPVDLSFRVVTISPVEAGELLSRFFVAGKVDHRLLATYADDMRTGRWALNGAPVVLSDKGEVLDGRLRLMASVQSQSDFPTLVVEGIAASAYETIDAIRKRTLADVLSIRHERNGRSLAAALRIIWNYFNGGLPGSGRTPSPTALLATLEDRPEIRDSIVPAMAAMPLLPHGCGIAMHHLMSRMAPERADRFLALIGEPVGPEEVQPVRLLRQVLAELRGKGGSRRQSYILAITIKAWNAFHGGTPLRLLRYAPDREAFPQIRGLEVSPGPLFDIDQGPSPALAPHAVTARLEYVTPERAEQLLDENKMNRSLSGFTINKYARDMAAGKWHLNGQTIKLSSTGKLLDGQHRLEASKKSGQSFHAIVVEGLSEESFCTLDIGRRRSVSDILREQGESQTIVLASALRWLWMIDNEVILSVNSSPTNGELLTLLDNNHNIRQSLKRVAPVRDIMGSGIAGALHHTFAKIDAASADEFFGRLADGVRLSEINPIYHLRERLIRTRAARRVRLAEAERVALTIKAWNSFRQGKPMQLLAWRKRGTMRETLPVPV